MDLVQLIKDATDILSSHGNIHVDIELGVGKRYKAIGLDIQKRNITSQELIAVIYGNEKDYFNERDI